MRFSSLLEILVTLKAALINSKPLHGIILLLAFKYSFFSTYSIHLKNGLAAVGQLLEWIKSTLEEHLFQYIPCDMPSLRFFWLFLDQNSAMINVLLLCLDILHSKGGLVLDPTLQQSWSSFRENFKVVVFLDLNRN